VWLLAKFLKQRSSDDYYVRQHLNHRVPNEHCIMSGRYRAYLYNVTSAKSLIDTYTSDDHDAILFMVDVVAIL